MLNVVMHGTIFVQQPLSPHDKRLAAPAAAVVQPVPQGVQGCVLPPALYEPAGHSWAEPFTYPQPGLVTACTTSAMSPWAQELVMLKAL